MKLETCRRCPAKIVFLYTKNQKAIPVDADTVKEGDVEFDAAKGHVTHFQTCPEAKKFKKPRPAAEPKPKPAPAMAAQGEFAL